MRKLQQRFSSHLRKVIIIGSGPAGYTAGIYSSRAMLSPLLISGIQAGGQLMLTSEVENYPGFPTGVSGMQLMDDMRQQAVHNGTEIVDEDVIQIQKSSKDQSFHLITNSGVEYHSQSVILSTGAQSLWLNAKNEDTFKGKGISTCATCDGFFFRNKEVLVIGGGDTAFEEALYLSNICSKVTLIHRREGFRASKVLYQRAALSPKIQILTNLTVQEWLPNSSSSSPVLGGAILRNTVTDERSELHFQGAFIAIGHRPSSQIFKDLVPLDSEGYVLVKPGSSLTEVPGAFACGDLVDKRYRQAITAAGMGCMAAMDCERWLSH